MKKLIVMLFLVLLGGQKITAQSGGWFVWENNPNKTCTIEDFATIAYDVERGMTQANTWFNLPSGGRYKILHPQEWFNTLLSCYQAIDPSITRATLVSAIRASDAISGNDMLYWVKNHYYGNGGVFFVNVNGASLNAPILIYKGYAVLKTNCGNPLFPVINNQITQPSSTMTVTGPGTTTLTTGTGTTTINVNVDVNCGGCNNSNDGYTYQNDVQDVEVYEVRIWEQNQWVWRPENQCRGIKTYERRRTQSRQREQSHERTQSRQREQPHDNGSRVTNDGRSRVTNDGRSRVTNDGRSRVTNNGKRATNNGGNNSNNSGHRKTNR